VRNASCFGFSCNGFIGDVSLTRDFDFFSSFSIFDFKGFEFERRCRFKVGRGGRTDGRAVRDDGDLDNDVPLVPTLTAEQERVTVVFSEWD
jgi:hypothetical protein